MKKLKCHCGAIEAEINIQGNLEKLLRCNCSLCKRKGAIMSMVKNENYKIIKGENKLILYQFHTKVAKHYFCSICGIYTGCIDEIDTFTLKSILINDGQNHPLDKK